MSDSSESRVALRQAVYALLIVASCAAATGRIMTVESASGRTPFLSANDRSRWSTIRALVDHGTFELDEVIFRPDGRRDRDWYSIDLVRHRGWDGREHFYSSKPTLLTIALAGEYWLIRQTLGITLADNPFYVGRLMLLLTNVVPLAIYLLVLARLVERYGRTDWGRMFVFTAAAFGTYITTFAVTLNNHTLAATTALLAVHAALHIGREKDAGWGWYAWAGLCAALTVTNELPALALLAMLGLALLWKSPLKAALGFGAPALLVAAAAIGTNYYAHGSWKTPYAHRGDGPVVAELESREPLSEDLNTGRVPDAVREVLAERDMTLSPETQITTKSPDERWMLWDEPQQLRLSLVQIESGKAHLEIRQWDNWYDYEGTYWNDANKTGVDRGEPSRLVYAFHCLIGHHGLFSLTPIWLLAAVGTWLLWRREEFELRGLAVLVATLTLVVLAFYIVQRPLADRNYGGVSTGLRWMFWFTPLWLIALLPAADRVSKVRWLRGLAYAMLAVSVCTSYYGSLNPWSQPWLFDFWTYLGWIEY